MRKVSELPISLDITIFALRVSKREKQIYLYEERKNLEHLLPLFHPQHVIVMNVYIHPPFLNSCNNLIFSSLRQEDFLPKSEN